MGASMGAASAAVHAIGNVEFRELMVDCGSATCRACRLAPSHGPYWYANWVEAGEPQYCRVGRHLSVEELRRKLSDDGRLHHRAIADLFRRMDSFERHVDEEAARRKAEEEARLTEQWHARQDAERAFARARAEKEQEHARSAPGPRVTWQSTSSSAKSTSSSTGPRQGAQSSASGPSPSDRRKQQAPNNAGRDQRAHPGSASSGSGRRSQAGSSHAGPGSRPGSRDASSSSSPWTVLGIPSSASGSEIKRAYRTLAMRFHPDKGGDVEAMKRLNAAYRRLQELGVVAG